ncbi:hypothetical protein LCL96_14030 [Rossellomorea aquimaris]|uniref:hypothetical protein n=1 Tax=Rossellomorea aquimaris TaxID=189382 RepID=UPI001CD3BD4D|nr:hypothetical protein [Rossellomorea aquimaris]MCA1060052.1 hypothetical protein [Rossellomorea aquimaris]
MKRYAIFVLSILTLWACSNQDSREWFETKEEAVEYGLQTADQAVPLKVLLSQEEFNGETIVFYELAGDLGVGSITESKKGYSWYEPGPYYGFEVEGDIPYSTSGFEYETESGLKVPILYGKVFDNGIEKMVLSGNGQQRELTFRKDSKWFFAIEQADFAELEVTPVRPGE